MSALPTNYLTPSGREEAWRFTPLKRIAGLHDPATNVLDRISIALSGSVRPGFTIEKVKSADLPAKSSTDDAVIQRVRATVAEVTHLKIAKEAVVAEPIVLTRTAGNTSEFSRTVITAAPHSKATVIVENSGNATIGEEIEIRIEAGAQLTFITLQEWSPETIHLGRHHAIVGRDATFNSITVTIGGSLVRLLPTVEYSDQGGSAELLGLYFATDGQHLETDTYELNKNLLLTDGARADSVPNLEIETGEIVGAGHASTTGRFDDEQLFYLMSRGIPMADARRLVIRGFFTEIINKIGNEVIQERLMNRIDAQLEKVGA